MGVESIIAAAAVAQAGASIYNSTKKPQKVNPNDYRNAYAPILEPRNLAIIDAWMKKHGIAVDPKVVAQVQALTPWAQDVWNNDPKAILAEREGQKAIAEKEGDKRAWINNYISQNPEASIQDANNAFLSQDREEKKPAAVEVSSEKPVEETQQQPAKEEVKNVPRSQMLSRSAVDQSQETQKVDDTSSQTESSSLPSSISAGASLLEAGGDIYHAITNKPQSKNPDDYRNAYATLLEPRSLAIIDKYLADKGIKVDPKVEDQVQALSPWAKDVRNVQPQTTEAEAPEPQAAPAIRTEDSGSSGASAQELMDINRRYRDAAFAAALQSRDAGMDPSVLRVAPSEQFSNLGQPTQQQQYQDVLNYIRAGRNYTSPYAGVR